MIRVLEYLPNPHYTGIDPGGLIRDRRKATDKLKAKRAQLSAGAILAFQPMHVKHVYSASLDVPLQDLRSQELVSLVPGTLFQFIRRSADSLDTLLCKPLDETSLLAIANLSKGQVPATSEVLLNMDAMDMMLWKS